ncbi:hypothetical protein ACFW4X_29565 [Streptomyces smyrnaeus]|uniref:hypothetical protein n=1 Tax=Streptomyces smyrnaeus TaxID=1387713 RepID=UPI0033FEE5C6
MTEQTLQQWTCLGELAGTGLCAVPVVAGARTTAAPPPPTIHAEAIPFRLIGTGARV